MSRLLLVRHAQASFLEQTYDKLSALGKTQSRLLGEFWARHKLHFDRVCSGPCVRQKDTAAIVAAAYRQMNLAFPELLVLPEFDEYQGEAVMERSLPALIESDREIAALHSVFQSSTEPDSSQDFPETLRGGDRQMGRGENSFEQRRTLARFCRAC